MKYLYRIININDFRKAMIKMTKLTKIVLLLFSIIMLFSILFLNRVLSPTLSSIHVNEKSIDVNGIEIAIDDTYDFRNK